jgi:hypothetical protein
MGYFDADDDFVTISDANDLAEAIAQVRSSPHGVVGGVALAGAIDGEGKQQRGGGGGGNDGTVLKIKVLVHQYEILKIVEDGVAGAVTPAGPPPPSAAGIVNGRLPLPPPTPPPRSPVRSPAVAAAVAAVGGGAMPYAAVGAPSPQHHHIVAAHDEELRWLRGRVTDLTEQVNRLQTLVHSLLPAEGRPHTGMLAVGSGAAAGIAPPGGVL